jgi:pilus assembly protein CpaB
MFQKKSIFVQRRRRGDSFLPQAIILAVVFCLTVVGAGMFIHVSAGKSNATQMAQAPSVILPQAGTVEVIVPINNIPPGSGFQPQMFKKELKPEVVVGPETVRSFDELKGMYSKGVLVTNRLVNRDFLTSLQPVNALTASIPSGYRAIAIAVDATSSVEGWAQPGARVDVVWVTDFTGKNTASMIAHNAKVLSANRRTEAARGLARKSGGAPAAKDDGIPPTVTLLLTVQDAMRVRLAALHGKLSLVLRGAEDTGGIASTGSIQESSLYGDNLNQAAALPQRNITVVKVKDPATGKQEELRFERGYRVRE